MEVIKANVDLLIVLMVLGKEVAEVMLHVKFVSSTIVQLLSAGISSTENLFKIL